MARHTIGIIVGSNRRASINRRLALALARLLEDRFDVRFIAIDDLPIYNGDLEGHRPAAVDRFTDAVRDVDALLFVSPEHNRSLTALLKNAIDWGSKPTDRNVWRDKPAAITGTSMGAIGTAVGQQHLRQILGILGMTVMGGEAYISFTPEPVDADGHFLDESRRAFLAAYMDRFATLVEKLS
ncbi:MAG TPA: NADPH-dependent FMN reductase [Casimicrobiaceae bacterium]|jgi:chromate reductase|nr:NADPH-dependent FMN reductase [Casimicrobiaceae bacterium]